MRTVLLAALLLSRAAFAAEDLPARIDRIVADVIAEAPAAGAAVEVVRKGGVIVKKGYGKADLELDVPMSERNVFRIGSITKQFTAAAIMRLVDKGKLALDADVRELLPDAPLHGQKVTIAQLLTHTSGLKTYNDLPAFRDYVALPLTRAELFKMLADQPFDFPPGQKWRYTNSGYWLLGLVVEKVSGKSYRDFLRDEVFARAGLTHTSYCDDDAIVPNRARGYSPDGPRLRNAKFFDTTRPFAAGALCSTVDDLVRWAQALASGKVVSPASFAKMTAPVKPADGSDPRYGFGLNVNPIGGHRAIGHGGEINGFNSLLLTLPDDGIVVAVLANSEKDVASDIGIRILEEMLGLPSRAPKAVPLADASRFVGVFRTTFNGEQHRLHVYAEAGRLWLRDDFLDDTDRLVYQGGDEFVIPHSPFRVRISAGGIDITAPDGRKMSGPREK